MQPGQVLADPGDVRAAGVCRQWRRCQGGRVAAEDLVVFRGERGGRRAAAARCPVLGNPLAEAPLPDSARSRKPLPESTSGKQLFSETGAGTRRAVGVQAEIEVVVHIELEPAVDLLIWTFPHGDLG